MPALRVGQVWTGAVARSSFRSLNCFDIENAAVDGPHASQSRTGEIPVSIEGHGDPQANLCRRNFIALVPSSRKQARPSAGGDLLWCGFRVGMREAKRLSPLSAKSRHWKLRHRFSVKRTFNGWAEPLGCGLGLALCLPRVCSSN